MRYETPRERRIVGEGTAPPAASATAPDRHPLHSRTALLMDVRLRFVQDVHRPGWSVAEVCRRYQVSRKTGYKWLERYKQAGPAGLVDRSHRPYACPHASDCRSRTSSQPSQTCPALAMPPPTATTRTDNPARYAIGMITVPPMSRTPAQGENVFARMSEIPTNTLPSTQLNTLATPIRV